MSNMFEYEAIESLVAKAKEWDVLSDDEVRTYALRYIFTQIDNNRRDMQRPEPNLKRHERRIQMLKQLAATIAWAQTDQDRQKMSLEQPPIDNRFVVEGCEQFSETH